jgi:Cu-Zn family superoxide dismutase
MKILRSPLAFACFAAALFACSPASSDEAKNSARPAATADVRGVGAAAAAKGTVTFTKEADGVRVVADLSGLAPGQHGIHVHEKGDCSAPDASSAGDHFNPEKGTHGPRDRHAAHVGDMGNIEADATGKAHLDYVDSKMTLDGADSVVGKAVIVHEKADDLATQPSGNSGARIACGVVEKGDASADASTQR